MSIVAALALFAAQASVECLSCHTPAREAKIGVSAVGLARWRETDCYGCHTEIRDVLATAKATGDKDRRYWALPFTEERRREGTAHSLSFVSAPKDVGLVAGDVLRVDAKRLYAFLQRPADVRRGDGEESRMMAFPSLAWDDVPAIFEALGPRPSFASGTTCVAGKATRTDEASASGVAGAKVFKETCAPCHATLDGVAGRPPTYLSLFTPGWLFAYANGLASRETPRRMPVFSLSRDDAAALATYFGEAREAVERRVDRRVDALDLVKVETRTRGRTTTADERDYVVQRFLREQKCVHCHATEGHRAEAKLGGTPEGLARWVGEHGAFALWKRLETRTVEVEEGLVARAPGMPMASAPTPEPLRDLLYVWAREGCPSPSGKHLCNSAKQHPKNGRGNG